MLPDTEQEITEGGGGWGREADQLFYVKKFYKLIFCFRLPDWELVVGPLCSSGPL